MLRSFFIYFSKATWARKIVTGWSVAWKMASRFVAGEKLEDAIRVIQALNSKGINATLDHLGEHTTTAEEARRATKDICDALEAIQSSGVKANVSIKLTQIGLGLSPEICKENLFTILGYAQKLNNFVRIDMEDSKATQITLDILHAAWGAGFHNTGIVIQSYLYRSQEDIDLLMKSGIAVRLCKGAYLEPAEVAYPKKSDVDANFDRLVDTLFQGSKNSGYPRLSADGRIPPVPGLATHDEKRILYAKQAVAKTELPKDAMEFQMLNGIRRDLQEQLVAEGFPVRIYVPYGTEWYPYFMRRLAERPANVWWFISNFFRR